MGAVQSSVNTEVLIAGAAVAVGSLTTIGLYARSAKKQDLQKPSDGATTDIASPSSASEAISEKKGKGKKKKVKEDVEFDRILATAREAHAKSSAPVGVVSFPEVAVTAVPGAFDQSSAADDSEAVARKEKKTKRKKGKKGTSPAPASGEVSRPPAASIAMSPDSSIVHVPADSPAEPARPAPSKKEKKKRTTKAADAASQPQRRSSPSVTQLPVPASSSGSGAGPSVSPSAADDASWTRVESRKRSTNAASAHGKHPSATEVELLTSDTNITTSVTGETESEEGPKTEDELEESTRQQTGNRKTFAEKMLGKPRRTGVEDMEEEPLQLTLARVIRARPASEEKPAKGFSWADYEEYAHTGDDGTSADGDEDDIWEEVKSKKRGKHERSASSSGNLPPKPAFKAPETLTKRQRQNQAKHEAAKAAKEAAEKERELRLAQHKRELERTRIAEQYASRGGKGKKVSGGMTASVEDGRLVWE